MDIAYRDDPPEPAAYHALYASAGWDPAGRVTPGRLARALEATWCIVCAYDGERLVGSGRVISDGALHAFVTELIVLPEYRGRGIGTAILERLVARCEAQGLTDVQLFAARGAVGFYRNNGFVERPADAPGMQWRGPAPGGGGA